MKYNPNIHHRHSIRLKDFDYSSEGAYYITICTENRQCILASARRGYPCGRPEIELTELGRICNNIFFRIQNTYNILITKYVIMPDHIHFILIISNENKENISDGSKENISNENIKVTSNDGERANEIRTNEIRTNEIRTTKIRATARVAPTVGSIVGGYKSIVVKAWLKKCKENNISMGKIWQRNYYEHIIRDEQDYYEKWDYIDKNPQNWEENEHN